MDSLAPVFGPPSSFPAPLGRVPTDEERSRDLTRIKIIATTLLVFSVVVAFAARLLETRHWSLGYVAAWAEAAAVGGLADWYAVVALFRHPCGVPLPHTAIISKNRERIAESFGDFVEEQFLAPDPIEQKLKSVDFAAAAADRLADEERSLSLSRFALRLLPQALSAIFGANSRRCSACSARTLIYCIGSSPSFQVSSMKRRTIPTMRCAAISTGSSGSSS